MTSQITVFLDPTKMPNQSQAQATFDSNLAAIFATFPTFGQQLNTLASGVDTQFANMASIAAGGAYAIPYTFDAATADTDPGLGKLRVDSSIAATGTIIGATGFLRVDTFSSGSQDFTSLIDTFDSSTSPIKGSIRLMKLTDPTKWAVFNVTSLAKPTRYRNIGVTVTAASSASPFVAADPLVLYFQRSGDKGDPGTLTQMLWVRDEKASGTSAGSSTAGATVQRALNTVKRNTMTGASLSSNQITLPAGTYRISFSAPAYLAGNHQAWIYNVTDGVVLLAGTSEYSGSATTRSGTINCELILAASKVLEIRHYTFGTQSTSGLGLASSSGQTEVYTELFIEKVA